MARLDKEKIDRMLRSVRAVSADCETDSKSIDGSQLSGLAIGTAFGNLLAQVNCLSRILEAMLVAEREAHT